MSDLNIIPKGNCLNCYFGMGRNLPKGCGCCYDFSLYLENRPSTYKPTDQGTRISAWKVFLFDEDFNSLCSLFAEPVYYNPFKEQQILIGSDELDGRGPAAGFDTLVHALKWMDRIARKKRYSYLQGKILILCKVQGNATDRGELWYSVVDEDLDDDIGFTYRGFDKCPKGTIGLDSVKIDRSERWQIYLLKDKSYWPISLRSSRVWIYVRLLFGILTKRLCFLWRFISMWEKNQYWLKEKIGWAWHCWVYRHTPIKIRRCGICGKIIIVNIKHGKEVCSACSREWKPRGLCLYEKEERPVE